LDRGQLTSEERTDQSWLEIHKPEAA
jgi:hypothetical protein